MKYRIVGAVLLLVSLEKLARDLMPLNLLMLKHIIIRMLRMKICVLTVVIMLDTVNL